MISVGHHQYGLALERIAEVTSERPARLFGMYPQKGVIRVGSDADFAVVDLEEKHEVHGADQFSAAQYSPWEGWEMKGRVRTTFLRGSKVFEVDRGFGKIKGEFISRRHSGEMALKAAQ
jgi:dihydropyrimidinase